MSEDDNTQDYTGAYDIGAAWTIAAVILLALLAWSLT